MSGQTIPKDSDSIRIFGCQHYRNGTVWSGNSGRHKRPSEVLARDALEAEYVIGAEREAGRLEPRLDLSAGYATGCV